VPFERGTIAQVIVKRDAGIIDEDIERFCSLDSFANLRSVGHVQGQGRDAPIQVGQGLARPGIHPLRASPQASSTSACPIPLLPPVNDDILIFEAHECCSSVRMQPGRLRLAKAVTPRGWLGDPAAAAGLLCRD
jgi:hypothetical protein